jgi:hypothetical protein
MMLGASSLGGQNSREKNFGVLNHESTLYCILFKKEWGLEL